MDALTTFLTKEAEAANTFGMPMSVPDSKKNPETKKAVINKTAEESCPDDNLHTPVSGEQPQRNAQAASLKPHMSIEGKEPPKLFKKKEAQYYAMPSQKKYPLDGYDQVIKAASYFNQWQGQMAPEHRREFCHNLVKRADAIGLSVSSTARKYGASTYAPAADFEVAIAGRRGLVKEGHQELLDDLVELQPRMSPDDFAITLGEFDKVAGINHLYGQDILDPYFSTFGEKTAAPDSVAALDQSPQDQEESFVLGNEIVTTRQLKNLAATSSKSLTDTFGQDFMKEFRKDPSGIFSSLPVDQKKILCRMANDDSPK